MLALVISRMLPRGAPSEVIDPLMEAVLPGEYRIHLVRDDASLELSVPPPSKRRFHLRLIGVEVVDLAEGATFLRQIVGPQTPVTLRFDRRRLSNEHELLGYLLLGDQLINAEIVRAGWARERTHASDSRPMARQILQAQDEARQRKVGIWSTAKK